MFVHYMASPIGWLMLKGSETHLLELSFVKTKDISRPNDLLLEVEKQLMAYFEGKRKIFDVPVRLTGTPFRKKVWEALQTIPYGEVVSYKDIAKKIGNPKASRAVGGANHMNPISIIIPCHRVIGVNGGLVGYGGGLDKKTYLLALEKRKRDESYGKEEML